VRIARRPSARRRAGSSSRRRAARRIRAPRCRPPIPTSSAACPTTRDGVRGSHAGAVCRAGRREHRRRCMHARCMRRRRVANPGRLLQRRRRPRRWRTGWRGKRRQRPRRS
jgi:hypothetical protein